MAGPHLEAPLPPQNLEAEEHVLCAIMNSKAAIDAVAPLLDPRDFYRESHGRIYRAVLELHTDGSQIDPLIVSDHLASRRLLTDVGGKERINELASLMLPSSNAAHHAQIVERMARFRDLVTVGNQISQLGWETGDVDTSSTRAQQLVSGLEERTLSNEFTVETWHDFEQQAHDRIPTLIDRLWPEAAFGFIAAPPKKGKTWVALALSIAVATGRPLFGHFTVPQPRPVLYVALEGHRAALRARVGAIARGMGLNPDPASGDLQNLHWLYKPRGINLADQRWADRLRRAADKPQAALITVDVLRAGARIKENDQEQFTNLRHNLQPISDDGRSLAVLHHFVKLSEISKERDPGERMSGSGAMFGALDVGIYITGSNDHATKLRLDFDTRDIATPNHINITLDGEGTGENGGYTYRDTATWSVTDEGPDEEDLKAAPLKVAVWLLTQPDYTATAAEIAYAFDCSDKTIARRHRGYEHAGITISARRGHPTTYTLTEVGHEGRTDTEDMSYPTQMSYLKPQEQAKTDQGRTEPDKSRVLPQESGDLQGKHTPDTLDFPTGSARARAREAQPETNGNGRYHEAEELVRAELWMLEPDDVLQALIDRWPMMPVATLEHYRDLAAALAAIEAGGDSSEVTP